ncbi:uncharacterized protein LOC111872073 isoform X2 [Cryptotermes secundus]|uniref:uncharacterized protein LOC111872073 isoform X2 n=1 Tax=Cryptotermes secundus TaxID=105785 RepID=UPI000CD7DAE7|nr:uncharacterized protein LOC111872073 isoform X2 [Cryptotermes secundus]
MFLVLLITFVLTTETSVGLNLGGLIGCKKDISVDFIQQCPEEPNMAVSFNEIFVLQINKNQCAFSGKIKFLEPVGEPWKLKFKLHKCKSKDNSKSCQDFFKFDVNHICQKLPQKNQVWSGFVEDTHIDTRCPLQPET